MAKQRTARTYRRVELRFASDDALLLELVDEAAQRGIELQHHIYDLLRGRFLQRQGQSLAALLWLPGNVARRPDEEMPVQASDTERAGTAAAAAWIDLLADEPTP